MNKELKCPKCGSEKRVKSSAIFAKNADATTREDNAAIQSTLGERQYSCIWKEMVFSESREFLKLAMFPR